MTMDSKTIYWSSFTLGNWRFYIGATSKGLCYISSPNDSWETFRNWAFHKFVNPRLIEEEEQLKFYLTELVAYFQGEKKHFSMPVDLQGTAFQQEVWKTLSQIPFGETRNYTKIAEAIGKPAAVRAVANAIGANPVLITIPCHRVIGKNGKLTGYRGGLEMKEHLLRLEK
ncbi:methylated-DNA--[protein]-cysteine S-methyltransferase [Paraliobacillus quinghaiensis]|uniref:methylated-DNA--[protein]-cysteine S-methyltransferase n=1 Tax=Paraliobacillus quinghaiensis TaxID=470815 RepID=A0A917TMM6_9BACI|nr:methylated-DNA--[protein]-cysteine S-methyltransferase [Paraliobacillus quinghaiensis]GGM27736.1 methylated-DNA--[protein]-cysteine S-methyltransferase [Paraliobacillus quinghaiensis]